MKILFLMFVLAAISFVNALIFTKRVGDYESLAGNPIIGIFGICLCLTMSAGIGTAFSFDKISGIWAIFCASAPWVSYFLVNKYKIKKEQARIDKIEAEIEETKKKQRSCKHDEFKSHGEPFFNSYLRSVEQDFICVHCGKVVTKYPKWDGSFYSFGGTLIIKSTVL